MYWLGWERWNTAPLSLSSTTTLDPALPPGGRGFRQRFAISPSEIARYRPCENRLQHFPVMHIYDHMISLYDSFVKLP